MSGLPTPPITPVRGSSFNFAYNTAEVHHPNTPNPHTYSLTPLQLLSKRQSYRLEQVRQGLQRLVVIDEPEIVREAPRLRRAMWGFGTVETENAEAAAILEAAVSRWLVSEDGDMMTRWVADDEVCFPLLFLSRAALTCGLETERSRLRSLVGSRNCQTHSVEIRGPKLQWAITGLRCSRRSRPPATNPRSWKI